MTGSHDRPVNVVEIGVVERVPRKRLVVGTHASIVRWLQETQSPAELVASCERWLTLPYARKQVVAQEVYAWNQALIASGWYERKRHRRSVVR